MRKIAVILTCFNRKSKTVNCVRSLNERNPDFNLKFIVVDDNSSDGTREAVAKLGNNIKVIKGSGNLFWAGGMRTGIDYLFKTDHSSEYVLLVNDDVTFKKDIIKKLVNKSEQNGNAVIVGATCDAKGNFTYGGMALEQGKGKGIYRHVGIDEKNTFCDLFNCNCVLIKMQTMRETGNFDPAYVHGIADLDYGLRLSRAGNKILSFDEYIGVCEKNSSKGTWKDTSLSRIERFKKKESPKGAPFRPWFHYVRKNFGVLPALKYSFSPYLKILFRR